jgi:hypothetical protein
LEDTQHQAALTCTGAYKHTTHTTLLDKLGWPIISQRRKNQRLNMMFKIQRGATTPYLKDTFPPSPIIGHHITLELPWISLFPSPELPPTKSPYFPKQLRIGTASKKPQDVHPPLTNSTKSKRRS